ncbi:MAG: type II secretion system F family protein [Streptosporangiaceae bacterium]
MNPLIVVAGTLAGLGVFVAVAQLIPSGPRLDAALARIYAAGAEEFPSSGFRRWLSQLAPALPWLPVPAADLALLGQDVERWFSSKIICGLAGLGIVPAVTALMTAAGYRPSWTIPAFVSLALGVGLFFAPDLVTKANAAERRADFRHALTSYLDLVALERGAGAGPTEALEAAAQIGGGWAFARIEGALDAARQAGRPPWEGLAALAAETGVVELADLADIAEVAGHEGAKILQTLAARAESMRAEALSATKAKAGARSTTMVVPIALLGAGFLLLLIFPIVYRTFG